jgi:hypothetical protein
MVDAHGPLDERERREIETLLGNHVGHIAFLGQERSGYGVVEGQGPPVVLATAAAALKAIGGWDETVPISIDVNGNRIAVRLSFDGTNWIADAMDAIP